MGLDLGQTRDYAALTVVERVEGVDGKSHYYVKYLHRFPLGTSGPAIVEHVEGVLYRSPLRGYEPIVVDATGQGSFFVDQLREAGLDPVVVKVHGGQVMTRDTTGAYRVPQLELVSQLAVLLENNRLEIAAELRYADILGREIQAIRAKPTPKGRTTYEAWRERDHDDCFFAVSLACWYGEHQAGVPVFGDDFAPAIHVSRDRVTPQSGSPIIRGWNLTYPGVVWFQIDNRRVCRVLLEQPYAAGQGLGAAKLNALTSSATLFPGFKFLDFVDPDALIPQANGKSLADPLRPEILPWRGEGALTRRLEEGRKWLRRLERGQPALVIDDRCVGLIRALQGDYMYRTVRGQIVKEPQDNASSRLVDALLVALAHPMATMTPYERQRMQGPRDFGPSDELWGLTVGTGSQPRSGSLRFERAIIGPFRLSALETLA